MIGHPPRRGRFAGARDEISRQIDKAEEDIVRKTNEANEKIETLRRQYETERTIPIEIIISPSEDKFTDNKSKSTDQSG
jgi:hypothetical protein